MERMLTNTTISVTDHICAVIRNGITENKSLHLYKQTGLGQK